MKQSIKLNEQEMRDYLPIIQKLETPGRLTVKLNREVGGLLVTLDGNENEIETYLQSWSENGIVI
jgi:hypothetical protein